MLMRTALCILIAGIAPSTALADQSFLSRFDGGWSGSGRIQRDVDASPRRVSCRVTGRQASPDSVSIAGTCRAAVIVTRRIGAEIRYDPRTRVFSGTYTGSTKGTAKVSGTQRGDALVLTITYPVPTYGDSTATMTIRNAGNGVFSMVVADEVDGATKETSNISFKTG